MLKAIAKNQHVKGLLQYINYSINFLKRQDFSKLFKTKFLTSVKEFLTLYKKAKMAKFRVSYQQYQLAKMEKMIAKSNEHFFLNGKHLNEKR